MDAETKILSARTALLMDHPFFGTLACQLDTVEKTAEDGIDTMATDGKHLFWCREFVDKLTKRELIFVLAHEVMHNAFEHHIRRQHREPRRWNIAADHAINLDLIEAKVGNMPKGGCADAQYKDLGAEEIYRLLPEDEGGGSGSGDDEGNDPGGCGGVIDACAAHDEAGKAEARALIQTQVRQAAAVAKAASGIGKLPAGIQRLVDELLAPKIDWREVLRRFIDSTVTRDYAWTRPNRRFLNAGFVLPGYIAEGINHLVIAVDTSGSIDHETLKAFAAEINGAFGDGNIDKMTVIYADATVHRVEEYQVGDELELRAEGGGGTAFGDTFRWIAENADDATAILYLTDLYVCDFGDEPAAPCMWVVYGDRRQFDDLSAKTPFGESIYLPAAA